MEHKWLRFACGLHPDPALNAGIELRPWQKLATTFLMETRKKFGFAMLGDEMGVGKVYTFPLQLQVANEQTLESLATMNIINQELRGDMDPRRKVHFVFWYSTPFPPFLHLVSFSPFGTLCPSLPPPAMQGRAILS
jgi:hypothetical protein